jgi:hypothetical protein
MFTFSRAETLQDGMSRLGKHILMRRMYGVMTFQAEQANINPERNHFRAN